MKMINKSTDQTANWEEFGHEQNEAQKIQEPEALP